MFAQSRIRVESLETIWKERRISIKSSNGSLCTNSFHTIPLISPRDSFSLSWYIRILLFIKTLRINCC